MPARHDGRSADQLRPLTIEVNVAPYASGSVLLGFGSTRVICAATIEAKVPSWMKQQGVKGGWLTAEYSMLPYSTLDRKPRDITIAAPQPNDRPWAAWPARLMVRC